MEWVGFLATVAIACWLLVLAYSLSALTLYTTGRWNPWSLVPVAACMALFWAAYIYAPFAIVVR